jgi:hypothetical protein
VENNEQVSEIFKIIGTQMLAWKKERWIRQSMFSYKVFSEF